MSTSSSVENEGGHFGTPQEVLRRHGLDVPEAAELDITVLVEQGVFGDYFWTPEVQRLRECGFDRDVLRCLAALDEQCGKKLVRAIAELRDTLEKRYGDVSHLADFLYQTPGQVQEGLGCAREALKDRSLLQALIDLEMGRSEDYIECGGRPLTADDYKIQLTVAYDPDNRLLMKPFESGIDEEGVIHDALGPFSSHRNLLVDQHGGLHELRVRPDDPFA